MSLTRVRRTVTDGLAIAAVGVAFALAANQFSPRGLSLRRNYFPPAPALASAASSTPTTTPAASDRDQRFARRGIALADHARVAAWYRDPRFAEGRIVFVDARDDRHFQAGHIPGAIQLDHYRLADHAAAVIAACQLAEQIVVYCTGGNCEDSELAAADLIDFGVPGGKVAVYVGGIDEWRSHNLPIETGLRGSGVRLKP